MDLKDLIIFRDFTDNETIAKAVSLFSTYNKENFIAVQREMADSMDDALISGTYWQNYIVNILAGSENIFSLSAEKGVDLKDSRIMELASLELTALRGLFELDFAGLINDMSEPHSHVAAAQNIAADFPIIAQNGHDGGSENKRKKVEEALTNKDANSAIKNLYDYHKQNGSGQLERYEVFEWEDRPAGIDDYDPISFDGLIGYETEKQKLIENTEFLLDGKKAANALLYGDSGTGKSSSVKALINRYKDRGLKLISIGKDQIGKLPEILEYTGQRGCKFIIFIDDLSFEDGEVEYKHFKSVLEGDVKSEPGNTVIYVTSNRRNIIREVWSERKGSDDVHLRDTLQEKKSLSDRFGLVITYSAPTKDEYLEIVKGLAEKNGLLADETLISEALAWDVRRAGRSGRTAKYFIDYYSSLMK